MLVHTDLKFEHNTYEFLHRLLEIRILKTNDNCLHYQREKLKLYYTTIHFL